MKRKSNLIIILLIILTLGCNNAVDNSYIIRGTVKEPKEKDVSLKIEDEILFRTLTPSGEFEFIVQLEESSYARLQYGDLGLPIFVKPGTADSFCWEGDLRGNKSIEGDNRLINTYLLDKVKYFDKLNSSIGDIYKKDVVTFNTTIDSIQTNLQNHLGEILSSLSNKYSDFADIEAIEVQYKIVNIKSSYKKAHKYFTGLEPETPEWYNAQFSQLDLTNETGLKSPEFLIYLHGLLNSGIKAKFQNNEVPDNWAILQYTEKLRLIPELFPGEGIANRLLYDIAVQRLNADDETGIDEFMMVFNGLCSDSLLKGKILSSYEDWKLLTKGSLAPDFSLVDTNNHICSLSDFKGKFLILDFWASWCTPCLREMQPLSDIEDSLDPDKYTIISVNLDNDKNDWNRTLQSKEIPGIHLYAEKGWDAEIRKVYRVKTIPRYVVIDPDGRIVDIKAPYPSENLNSFLTRLSRSEE